MKRACGSLCQWNDEVRQPSYPNTRLKVLSAVSLFHQAQYSGGLVFRSCNLIRLITFAAPARILLCEIGFCSHYNCHEKIQWLWVPFGGTVLIHAKPLKVWPPHHRSRTIIANINMTRRKLASQHVPKTMFDFVYNWDVFWEPQDSVNLLEKCWLGQRFGRSKPNCFRWLPRGVGMSSKKESTYIKFHKIYKAQHFYLYL